MTNAFGHVVWKMAAYGLLMRQDMEAFLSARNIVHHVIKLHRFEFDEC